VTDRRDVICAPAHTLQVPFVTKRRTCLATYDRITVFRVPPPHSGNSEGHVDYRLARASVLADYRDGLLDRAEVCDAHPELVRAARQVGRRTPGECPVCDRSRLVHVTYVFGPRLPKHGRCISLRGELTRLAKRPGTHVAFVVEVCQACSWNHLVRRSTLERPKESPKPDPDQKSGSVITPIEAAGDVD